MSRYELNIKLPQQILLDFFISRSFPCCTVLVLIEIYINYMYLHYSSTVCYFNPFVRSVSVRVVQQTSFIIHHPTSIIHLLVCLLANPVSPSGLPLVIFSILLSSKQICSWLDNPSPIRARIVAILSRSPICLQAWAASVTIMMPRHAEILRQAPVLKNPPLLDPLSTLMQICNRSRDR